MGTADFGVPALEKLVEAGHDVRAVIAQPDRPNKRGKKIAILPLKAKAMDLGIDVLQPEKIKDPIVIEELIRIDSDIFIVAAYGQMLSKEILEIPQYGAINIHGSLLPKYRGAAPIQRAIINGDKKTGVTIMQMGLGMDTGDMLSKAEIEINNCTTVETLYHDLAEIGGDLLIKTIEDLMNNRIIPICQNENDVSYADKILKDTGHIQWTQKSTQIVSLINGTDPQPGAYFYYEQEKIKCFEPEKIEWSGNEMAGGILIANSRDGLVIKTKDGAVKLGEIQIPGKKRMEAKVALRGKSFETGVVLK